MNIRTSYTAFLQEKLLNLLFMLFAVIDSALNHNLIFNIEVCLLRVNSE